MLMKPMPVSRVGLSRQNWWGRPENLTALFGVFVCASVAGNDIFGTFCKDANFVHGAAFVWFAVFFALGGWLYWYGGQRGRLPLPVGDKPS